MVNGAEGKSTLFSSAFLEPVLCTAWRSFCPDHVPVILENSIIVVMVISNDNGVLCNDLWQLLLAKTWTH